MEPEPPHEISGLQSRAARAMLRWTVTELAEHAKVARNTVLSLEADSGTSRRGSLSLIRRAFEDAGIEFVGDYGVLFRKKTD